ncbi:hypothetical protein GW17_00019722 [Ensete ventricosum]|nr:hypothetical protein GW17_00019722 [Ensete ventricosum]
MSTRIHSVAAPSDGTEPRRGILHAGATDPCERRTDRPTSHTPWTDGVRRHRRGETKPIVPRLDASSSTFPIEVGVGEGRSILMAVICSTSAWGGRGLNADGVIGRNSTVEGGDAG